MAFLLAAFSCNLSAADRWIRLATPHFDMYTTNSEKQGTAALKVFEQVRYFFLEVSRSKTPPDAAVRIIAFRSEKEYKPYRISEGAFAYYLRSQKVDYIVMQDISPEHYQSAIHEYTHLVVEHMGLKLPVWLNEGLADLYSSLEPRGDKALVGRPLAGRIQILQSQRWLDLNTLFSVDANSPHYNEADKMSIFYSQSWALTHMLELGDGYRENFQKFLSAIVAGQSAADALHSVYGKNFADVTKDLQAYVRQSTMNGSLYDVKLPKSDLDPEVSEPSDLNVDLALADLLASSKRTMQEASSRFSALASEHPESAEVHESLAYLAWQQGDRQNAKEHFKLAIDKGSKDPKTFNNYAALLHETGAKPSEVVPVLQKLVELKPDFPDARLNLGVTEAEAGQIPVALQTLSQITKVTEDRAYALFVEEAYCYMRLNQPEQARPLLVRAQQYAKTPEQRDQVARSLQELDAMNRRPVLQQNSSVSARSQSPPDTDFSGRPNLLSRTPREIPRDQPSVQWPGTLQHVEAVAKFFECSPQGARLHVLANSKELVLEISDPQSIVIRNFNKNVLQLSCGAQKPFNVGIFYTPATAPSKVDGTIREMVF